MEAHVTSVQSRSGLTVVQFATEGQDTFAYVSAKRAMQEKLVEVKELEGGGRVNKIAVLNLSDRFVFLMDGDILIGAKQNRVVNTSILLAPSSKTIIPVSCVEAGRWQHISGSFAPTDYVAPSQLREEKARQVSANLKKGHGFAANQSAVWERVSGYEQQGKVKSPTSSLSDVFSGTMDDLEKLIAAFVLHGEANGMAVFRGRRLLSIDAFNRRNVYAEYYPSILRGVALEVMGTSMKEELAEAEARFRTLDFFDVMGTLPWEAYPAVAAGREERFETDTLAGLQLRYEEHMIHLTAFGNAAAPR